MKENKWKIELTQHQLMLIAECVEDCHRFMAGQTELDNTTAWLRGSIKYRELKERLGKLQPLVTPELGLNASYGWNGGGCPNEYQRKFIAQTYYLYREIYHQINLNMAKQMGINWNVYLDDTLTCKESGEPIKVEMVEK